jgi:hypothetical protein
MDLILHATPLTLIKLANFSGEGLSGAPRCSAGALTNKAKQQQKAPSSSHLAAQGLP